MAIRLLLADDDRLITESMNILIGTDDRFEIVATVHNGRDAVDECKKNEIDVALLDLRMPILNGVDATRQIVNQTNTKVLVLTTFDEDEYISKCFEYGAKGYLLKNNPPELIMNAIISVFGGNSVVQDDIMKKMAFSRDNKESRIENLTDREKDIVRLIAKGQMNKDIAQSLYISEGTVKNNITNILAKLDLKHRTQIAIYYLSE